MAVRIIISLEFSKDFLQEICSDIQLVNYLRNSLAIFSRATITISSEILEEYMVNCLFTYSGFPSAIDPTFSQ